MTFGEKLQHLRKLENISQEQLAEQISVSRQAVSKWELGASLPDTENVLLLSRLFDVSTDYLLIDDVTLSEREYVSASASAPHGQSSTDAETLGGTFEQRPASIDASSSKPKRVSIPELVLFCLSAGGVLILGIFSSIFPAYITYPMPEGSTSDALVKTGFPVFLEINNLTWLFVLCCSVAALVAVIWIFRYVAAMQKRFKTK